MGIEKALAARQERRDLLRREVLERVRRAAGPLRSHFEFEALYVVGSVLGPRFRLTSDLDLVVKGGRLEDFHRMHAFLMGEVGGPLDIDLKPFEDLGRAYRRRVEEEGLRVG